MSAKDGWPTIVLAGPPVAGKSLARLILVMTHGCPPERVLEAQVWPWREPSPPFELRLWSRDDLEVLRRRVGEVVLVWLDAPVEQRHQRLTHRAQRDGVAPPDLAEFAFLNNWPGRVLAAAGGSATEVDPAAVMAARHQWVWNTASTTELEQHLRRVVALSLNGFYSRLRTGETAMPLGWNGPPVGRPGQDYTIIELPGGPV